MTTTYKQKRQEIHEARTFGEKAADFVQAQVGSWRFVIAQSVFTVLWILANSIHGWNHWDDYPFVLLNLCYSFQAGFTGPIFLLSGNRQASKDRKRDDLEAEEVAQLIGMNEEQLQILKGQNEILDLLHKLLQGNTISVPTITTQVPMVLPQPAVLPHKPDQWVTTTITTDHPGTYQIYYGENNGKEE